MYSSCTTTKMSKKMRKDTATCTKAIDVFSSTWYTLRAPGQKQSLYAHLRTVSSILRQQYYRAIPTTWQTTPSRISCTQGLDTPSTGSTGSFMGSQMPLDSITLSSYYEDICYRTPVGDTIYKIESQPVSDVQDVFVTFHRYICFIEKTSRRTLLRLS